MPSSELDLVVANVVAMRSTQVGDYVYRVSQPSLAMGRLPGVKIVTVGTLSPHLGEVCREADVLILHLLSEDDLFPLVHQRKRVKRPTVYEISDQFSAAHQGVGIEGWFADPVHRSNAFQLLRLADATQVTGAGLLEHFGKLSPRTAVFENQVERVVRKLETPRKTVRLGWAGSAGHTEDLREIRPVIAALCARYPELIFDFMGNARQYEDVFGALPSGQRTFTPPGTLEAYYSFLEGLDLGLAPMVDNPYNRCRSDVKFVEYASRGVVPVLRAITPYLQNVVHGENGFLYRTNGELGDLLAGLIEDPQARAVVGRRAFAYVSSERLEGQHAPGRIAFYRGLAGPGLGGRRGNLEVPLVRGRPDSESWEVESSPAERSLVAGLHLDALGAGEAARARYREAHAAAPGFDLPLFWLGRSHQLRGQCEEAAGWFSEALDRNPWSLRAALHLAQAIAAKDPAAALAVLEEALSQAPTHAPTLEAMARLHEDAGARDQALALYQAAFTASPHFGRVATRLGQLYAQRGEHAAAGRMFERASELRPADAKAHLDLAEHLLATGAIVQASRRCIRALELDRGSGRAKALLQQLIAAIEPAAAKSA